MQTLNQYINDPKNMKDLNKERAMRKEMRKEMQKRKTRYMHRKRVEEALGLVLTILLGVAVLYLFLIIA